MSAYPDATLLAVHGLACTLGGRHLWTDVSFTLRAGERRAVAGPSGSGKTQLLRTLAGLVPTQAGNIRFAGRPLAAWPMPAYRARVVYVPQRPSLPEGRVAAALAAPFGLRVHRARTFPDETLPRYLDALELDAGFTARDTADLSGGETQLVATLRALLVAPSALLLDEPTASLDGARAARLEKLIGEWLAAGRNRAYVWTSHDREQLARVSDHALTLRKPA